ncbi:hypothetical protein Acr_26g0011080 [Actinidia rufa]|uniref:Transmembrane protein n=1 Tax=Actinidia rufa TaxID=165716 RepID=A0A7J0H483_9ERIC|nr:hypothetical protein Acr_26g0011080 [Actinidia rufa]
MNSLSLLHILARYDMIEGEINHFRTKFIQFFENRKIVSDSGIALQIMLWKLPNAFVVILMSRSRNAIVATGLLAFASAGLAFPFYMASRSSKMKPVIDSSKPLPPQATFRGPYINTGSRDIGPDHQTYQKK